MGAAVRTCVLLATTAVVVAAATVANAGLQAPSASGEARVVVPRVVGMRMDRATRTLRSVGLRVNEECSGLIGCIVKSQWWVCAQDPRPGTRLRRYSVVVIYGERRRKC